MTLYFVQEHWLAPFDLDQLNTVNPDVMLCILKSVTGFVF